MSCAKYKWKIGNPALISVNDVDLWLSCWKSFSIFLALAIWNKAVTSLSRYIFTCFLAWLLFPIAYRGLWLKRVMNAEIKKKKMKLYRDGIPVRLPGQWKHCAFSIMGHAASLMHCGAFSLFMPAWTNIDDEWIQPKR